MPRPRIRRRIGFMPGITHFKPAGVRLAGMQEVVLNFEESEAVRLNDYEGIGQTEAAKKMKVSQPTFNRILASARKKIADAIINGKAIRIEGGDFKMVEPRGRGGGMGRGMGRGFGGPADSCVCPACGAEAPKQRGMPCASMKCPKCGARMARK
jgi:predicted DNA-binding protein (UPF0251 family)